MEHARRARAIQLCQNANGITLLIEFRSVAVFDVTKLDWLNGTWIRESLDDSSFADRVEAWAPTETRSCRSSHWSASAFKNGPI